MIQVDFALQEGLLPGFERMKQLVRDCETELQEMSQIEAYRRDEERAVHIRVEAAEHPGVAAGKGHEPKRARTVDLVARAITALLEARP